MRRFLASAVLGLWAGGAAAGVMECMSANLPRTLRVQSVELTTWDRAGQQRVMKGRIFGSREKERGRLMALVEHPGDLAGAAFLVRESEPAAEFYVYLPSVKRVKRLAGANMTGKLWGTDFSYNEFRRVANAFADGAVREAGGAQHDGRAVHVLDIEPGKSDGETYDAIRVWVDRQACVPLQAEFRRAGRTFKRMTAPAASLRQAGTQWYVSELTLSDLVEGTRTRLRVVGVSTGTRVSASAFHPQQFYSVR